MSDKLPPKSNPSKADPAQPIRSMTGFARIAADVPGGASVILTLKSVNHRHLDLQFHLPNDTEQLEIEWRRLLKRHIARGHVDVRLSLQREELREATQWNPAVVRSYVEGFRAAAAEHHLPGEPDLNVAFRLPGAWTAPQNEAVIELTGLQETVAAAMLSAIEGLNTMRALEGRALADDLRQTMTRLLALVEEMSELRIGMQQAYAERLDQKMRALLENISPEAATLDRSRILQEAALLAERSDVEEEMVRMRAHVGQFQELLNQGGELGKKLDFLLQEMAREANTTLSKTGGIATRSLRMTELGLAMKSEIEKAREQVQNIE